MKNKTAKKYWYFSFVKGKEKKFSSLAAAKASASLEPTGIITILSDTGRTIKSYLVNGSMYQINLN